MYYERDWLASFIYNSNRIEEIMYPLGVTKQIIADWEAEQDPYEKSLYEKQYPEIIDHYQALLYVLTAFKETKLKVVHVFDIHRRLMKGLLPGNQAGHFRTVQVYVGQHIPPASG